eukprot:CAMPEP_0174379526 /NCGR_PEP_ID=MMETSP0811_2-20130205/122770_1 /TAXON_ID=73025 ORGANISM="Eutreptiella gymnastica-like, Strain CCMP1594" /NCGR_SAMPLE_ID=MMETSP0811_2 /ASSEMBLY_ACC=CAM_ASM_000667 /LENGTH=35 /DNA_ID= /DNA_START= /DNA_END= /DNA_ORIENTATION=
MGPGTAAETVSQRVHDKRPEVATTHAGRGWNTMSN